MDTLSPTSPLAVVWFRNTLRIHDNPPLMDAMRSGLPVLGVVALDPREFEPTPIRGLDDRTLRPCGVFRAQLMLDAIKDLRKNLATLQIPLAVYHQSAANSLAEIQNQHTIAAVYASEDWSPEGQHINQEIQQTLVHHNVVLHWYPIHPLIHPENFPSRCKPLAPIFSHFRKQLGEPAPVIPPLASPTLASFHGDAQEQFYSALGWNSPSHPWNHTPTLEELGFSSTEIVQTQYLPCRGGETIGLERLLEYLWDSHAVATYKETRNELHGWSYSTKFSPYLSQGSLSPRRIWQELDRYEATVVTNDSTYWVRFELLWREYFQYWLLEHGPAVRSPYCIQQERFEEQDHAWSTNSHQFQQWCRGETGFPLVDANMRELNTTGYMSNRGRQNVASFLTKTLNIDWRWGEAYFQSLLIDYDAGCNIGNWAYTAGVGNDPRDRIFNVVQQSRTYDPDGIYLSHWCPELTALDPSWRHAPFQAPNRILKDAGLSLGRDYPLPMVIPPYPIPEPQEV